MIKHKGAVAAGHPQTVAAAKEILSQGGNAFDAAIAAICAACVCEPVLASLGGGGFLLAHSQNRDDTLYDFFVHTPRKKCSPTELDFFPIQADFGTTTQEFHIGKGAIALPGVIKGLYALHRKRCSLPMKILFEPAIKMAREGVKVNGFQAYIFQIISPILESTDASKSQFASPDDRETILAEGEVLKLPQLAGFFETLANEGEALFYQGASAPIDTPQTISM